MGTTSSQRSLWLIALFCAATGVLPAADAPRGRPIEFSEPRSERTNNVQSLMPGHNTMLDQLEADVNRPFKSIIPGNSLNGIIMPDPASMPQPAVSSARVRELINKQNDRKYLSPEELYAPKTLEDKYKVPELTPDGRDLTSLPANERQLIRALDGNRSKLATNQMNAILGPGYANTQNGLFGNANGVNPAGFGTMNPQESNLRRILGMDNTSNGKAQDQLNSRDLFGLGDSFKPPQKLTPAELQRRDAFMQIYNNNYVAPVDGAAPSAGTFSTPYVDSSFYDPPKPAAPAAAAVFSGSALSAASTATPYTPAYVPPPAPAQPTPRPEPVSPFMSVPKRVF